MEKPGLKSIKNIDYEIEQSMATFTMLQVLKSKEKSVTAVKNYIVQVGTLLEFLG
mgnify:CR=1 FL=1